MKINQWTLGLAAAGVVSLASAVQAEEAAANQVMTAVSATTLSGYVDTSIVWRPGSGAPGSGGGTTGLGAFTGVGKQDGFNLNVVKLRLEKALDESEWSAGYRAELLFGPDAVAGGGYNPSGFGGDVSIKDAYVQLRAPIGNGLDFKLGSFATFSGYEVFEAGDNANYSRSYAWQMEPTQHTGLLANYKVNDSLNLKVGVANTFRQGINARTAKYGSDETRKTYMAGFTLTAPDSMGAFKGATLTGTITKGHESFGAFGGIGPAVGSDTTAYYAGITTPTGLEGLTVGISYDYIGVEANTNPAVLTGSAYFNAVALYTSYQASEKLKFNLRGEYATSSNGILDAMSGGPVFPFTPGTGASGNKVIAATLTTDYALWANVVSRLELRWDHDCSQAGDGLMFDTKGGFGAKNQLLVALNVIYKF